MEKKIIRFEKNGPARTGLAKMELDTADFQSDLPEQHVHVYYEDEDLGLNLGVWTTTDMQELFGPYPGDEFMWVLEGQVAMVDGDGTETVVKQGETFCIRNAIPISWKQVGFLRKFYMTYDNPNAATPDIASADGGVMVIDADMLKSGMKKMGSTDPFEIGGEAPVQHDNIAFTNDAGNMFVGMWDSTAFKSEMKPFPCHEFVQLLEGEVTITEGDGTAHDFGAGDVFFIPEGTVCSWNASGYIKKFYSILDTSA
ncbi:MAG: DUF861 domain-containing protein [Rhodospirillales bacterium]|nr:DUF861 domain-containing protein [Rhodospirillales bacterium]MBT4040298.1 DUF861 domain-containing protein [Rhodospirillales bacterium]MBT4625206.1 DUF861 domain-containing protein [Rhodospirillales bacterium]MBT5350498.1 DUF861 domain-containing protein [Rhodospirillales bacterium]MBT5520931.1 DUF861 domain-containing protein [Rhodospirillales bacterium]